MTIQTDQPNWLPLEIMLRRTGRPAIMCGEFMWMGRVNGVEYYKSIATRRYLLLDSELRCVRPGTAKPGVEPRLEVLNFDEELNRVLLG